jgi:hypothetical protein
MASVQFEPMVAIILIPFFLWIGHYGWGYFWNPPEHHQMPIVYLFNQGVRFALSLFFVYGAASFLIFLIVVPLVIKVRDALRSIRN